jgi:hypothetical protein
MAALLDSNRDDPQNFAPYVGDKIIDEMDGLGIRIKGNGNALVIDLAWGMLLPDGRDEHRRKAENRRKLIMAYK